MSSAAKQNLLRFLYTGSGEDWLSYDVSHLDFESEKRLFLREQIQNLPDSAIEIIQKVANDSNEGFFYNKSIILQALATCTVTNNSTLTSQAYHCVNDLCKDSESILQFVEYCESLSKEKDNQTGWGRSRRRAVQEWYRNKRPYDVAFEVTSCYSHNKWSHKDLMRLCHIKPTSSLGLKIVCAYIARGFGKFEENHEEHMECDEEYDDEVTKLSELLHAIATIKSTKKGEEVAALYNKHKLSWGHVPCQWHNDPVMWKNLINQVPLKTLLQNLPRLHNVKVLENDSSWLKCVVERVMEKPSSEPNLHPFTYFWFRSIYDQGRHHKKKFTWKPSVEVLSALDTAFYSSMKDNPLVAPTNKLIDVSVNLNSGKAQKLQNSPYHSCNRVTAALCYFLLSTEKNCEIKLFSKTFDKKLTLTEGKDTLRTVTSYLSPQEEHHKRTDCALPLIYAKKNHQKVDTFIIITNDDPTLELGRTPRMTALEQYRTAMKCNARLIVIALGGGHKARKDDYRYKKGGILDISGFNDQVPFLINSFMLKKF